MQAQRKSIYILLLSLIITLILFAAGQAKAAAVDFQLADVDGIEHRLSDYRGYWVVVNYWATWCAPCRDEMPDLQQFHNAYQNRAKNKAIVIGINMEEAVDEEIREFIKHFKITYPNLLTEVERKGPLGEISGLPTTFVISPKGEVVKRILGRVDMNEIIELVD